jgi:hypothetical protein
VLDPGVPSAIVAVVPRTESDLMLGFADGRVGVYHVPDAGGETVDNVPLVSDLIAFLKHRPDE